MKKWLRVSGLFVLIAGPAIADAVYYPPQVTGKRERKNIRHYLFVQNLAGDKRSVYDEYGYTPYRLRLNEYGRVREQWTYYEVGKLFVFDQCGTLVETRSIEPEQRRQWAYERDVRGYDENLPCDD
jgi:hypothetical protein